MIILLVLFSCIKEFSNFKLVHKGKYELIEAIRMGKINEIVPLINSPEDINEVDENNKSALGFALSNGNRDIVEILLSKGGDISKVKKEDLFEFINKTKKEKNRGSLLHFMILNNMEEEALSFLDKIIELKENERDEILKQEDEKGKEAIYLALDREMYELTEQMLRLYSKEERKERLGFKNGASKLFFEALEKKSIQSIFLILNLKREYKDENKEKEDGSYTQYENKIVEAFESIYEVVEEGIKDNFLEESIFLSFLKECLKKKGKREKINVEEFLSKIDKKKREDAFLLGLILGEKKVVNYLLQDGNEIDVNVDIQDERTPLYVTSFFGNREVVKLLIEEGAYIDKTRNDGTTPLFIASFTGHTEVVELLITKGAYIDSKNNNGATSLFIASQLGKKEVVELLLKNGASIDLENKNGATPLFIASQNGHKEVVELLIGKGADINKAKNDGATPLIIASFNGHKEVVDLLLAKGASIDKAETTVGATPLIIASQEGKKEVIELLIEKGADINKAETKVGATPLYVASQNGHTEIVELLLAKDATIDLGNKNGETPLYIASYNGHKEVVELLINKGADINLVSKYGKTPIYISSFNGHKEVLACLICKGANIPKFIANDKKYSRSKIIKQMIEYFQKKGLKDSSWCFTSSILLEKKHFPIIQDLANDIPLSFLKDNFFSIPDLNYYGYNSLHFCMFQNNTNSLKALLSDSNIRDFINSYDNKEQESCLGLAVRLNKLDHIKVLLSHCASPVYFKHTLLASIPKRFNVLEEFIEIREYVSNKMIFDILKEGRTEDGARLLFGHTKLEKKAMKGRKQENILADLEPKINNFSYKDVINLKAVDSEDKNVFHCLAIYGRGIDVSEFLIRSLSKLPNMEYEIPSFSEELLFAYDKFGYTPFHYALLNSNEDFVEAFLTDERIRKEDINKVTKEGRSIFNLIEGFVSKEVVTLLIKYLWSKEDIKLLYESAKVKEEDKNIYLLIKESKEEGTFKVKVKMNNVEIVEEESISANAIEAFENLHFDDSNILRAMNLAYIFNAGKCLEIVLSKMTEQQMKMRVTLDLMMKACRENKEEILSLLIGTDKEKLIIQDKDGNTLLHQACIEGKIGIVRELLKHEIVRKNIDIQNKLGNTAMHNAHICLSPSIIIELKEAGAEIGIRNKSSEEDKRGIDLLKDRTMRQNEELIKLGTIYASLCCILGKEYDADYERILHLAIEAGEYWIVNDLSTHGFINLQDKDGNTPLHLVVKQDGKEVVDTLMKNGSSFFIMNNKKETAISLIRSKEMLMKVIQNAIENRGITSRYILGVANEEGNTLLHLVAERVKRGEIENISAKGLIRAILDNGGKKDRINLKGERAINILAGNEDLVKFLKSYEPNYDEMKNREEYCYEKRRLKDEENKRNQEEEKELIAVLNGEREHDGNSSNGRRAIHLVVERNDEFALIELLKKGSDPNWEDKKGKNCYEIGIANNSIDAFKVLIKRVLIDDVSVNGPLVRGNIFEEIREHASPFYLGVEKGGIFFDAVFKRLKEECENGYNIHKLRELKHNPIDKIIELNRLDIMEKLVELGLKIEDRESPLIDRLISRNNILKVAEEDNGDMLEKLIK